MNKIYHKLSKFLTSNTKNKKSYSYSKYSNYERYFDEYCSGDYYVDLMNNLKKTSETVTNTPVRLIENKNINGISVKDILKKYGKPYHKIVCEELLGIKVLLYKKKIGHHNTKIAFHYMSNKLIMYNYTFSHSNADRKNEILQIIKEKYLNGEDIDSKSTHIVDRQKNIILINDYVDLSINYLNENDKALETIINSVDQKNKRTKTRNKEYREILYKNL